MELKITPSGQTIVKPTALGPVANTDSKLLIYGLFQKGRVLAQDGHQRRARRAELASFSVLVSNLDFRVPRLRPNRRTGADLAVRQRKRGHPRGPESRPRLSRRSRPSTFWSRCNPGLLDVHLSPGMDPGPRPKVWHPVSGRCFPARTGDPESPAATPGRNQRWIDFLRSTTGCRVCNFRPPQMCNLQPPLTAHCEAPRLAWS